MNCDHKHETGMWKTGLMANIGLRINTKFVLTEKNNINDQEQIDLELFYYLHKKSTSL